MNSPALRAEDWQAPTAKAGRAATNISSKDILRGERKIIIQHDDSEYTLQVTRQNKLLLTK